MRAFFTNHLPKAGMFILTGFSTSFLYFYYSMTKLFQLHQESMLSADYYARFNAAPCSEGIPSTCFWEKFETTSPQSLNSFRNEMFETLPLGGLVGGVTMTFLYHYGDKIRDTFFAQLPDVAGRPFDILHSDKRYTHR
jgi:hypothetical protein